MPTSIATLQPSGEEQAIYEYIEALFDSEDNPAKQVDIGIEGLEAGTDEYNAAVQAFNERVEKFENECMEKAAEQFGKSKEEIEQIYLKVVGQLF